MIDESNLPCGCAKGLECPDDGIVRSLYGYELVPRVTFVDQDDAILGALCERLPEGVSRFYGIDNMRVMGGLSALIEILSALPKRTIERMQ